MTSTLWDSYLNHIWFLVRLFKICLTTNVLTFNSVLIQNAFLYWFFLGCLPPSTWIYQDIGLWLPPYYGQLFWFGLQRTHGFWHGLTLAVAPFLHWLGNLSSKTSLSFCSVSPLLFSPWMNVQLPWIAFVLEVLHTIAASAVFLVRTNVVGAKSGSRPAPPEPVDFGQVVWRPSDAANQSRNWAKQMDLLRTRGYI